MEDEHDNTVLPFLTPRQQQPATYIPQWRAEAKKMQRKVGHEQASLMVAEVAPYYINKPDFSFFGPKKD
jgi:hypothetical protein